MSLRKRFTTPPVVADYGRGRELLERVRQYSESNPFARASNVTFPNGQWTRDISHGEMIRSGTDQAMEISSCNLRYLYQGMNPSAGGDYNRLPWRLGLLTQTNSSC